MFATRAFLSAMSKSDVSTVRDHARTMVRMFDMIIKNLDAEDSKRRDTTSEFDPRLLGTFVVLTRHFLPYAMKRFRTCAWMP